MTKKTSTREFKLKVMRAVESGELRPAQACREYQIAERVLNRWLYEVRLPSPRWKRRPLFPTTRRALPTWSGSAANSPWRTPP